MRILLTGRNGQVGWELERSLAGLGELIAMDRQAVDLADSASLAAKTLIGFSISNAALRSSGGRSFRNPASLMRDRFN